MTTYEFDQLVQLKRVEIAEDRNRFGSLRATEAEITCRDNDGHTVIVREKTTYGCDGSQRFYEVVG